MKRFLIAIVALVIGISLSAFKTLSKKEQSKRTLNAYTHWYLTTDNGTKVGMNIYTGVDKNKTQISSGCPDSQTPVCAVGNDGELNEGALIPASDGPGDNYILED